MSRIYFFLGTKGQLIKTMPVMKALDERGVDYTFINAAQHKDVLEKLIKSFSLKQPGVVLSDVGGDVSSTSAGLFWFSKNLFLGLIRRRKLFPEKGVCVVHGDALPALLGLLLAKLSGIKVAHIEAGERTHKLLNPFPEELIRVVVDRHSDYLFALSKEAMKNLREEGVKGEVFDIGLNTVFDAVQLASQDAKYIPPGKPYVIASIHRLETLKSRKKLKWIVETIKSISEKHRVVFPLHASTKKALKDKRLLASLEENTQVDVLPLQDYKSFIHLMKNAEFIFTDGGGPQCESYYLGTPCLLARERTEYPHCENTLISELNSNKIEYFLNNTEKFRKQFKTDKETSKEIADILSEVCER